MTRCPHALGDLADALKDDHDFVLRAVAQDGLALSEAGQLMRDDPQVVIAAGNHNALAVWLGADLYSVARDFTKMTA